MRDQFGYFHVSRITFHFSFHPIRDKDVRLALNLIVSVRCEHQLLSVGAEHRKSVECRIESDSFEPRAVDVDRVEIEVPALRISHVRREDDALAVWEEIRSEVR